MPRKKVLIIHTGGTLGMKMPGHTRAELAPNIELDRLINRVPELEEIADIELISPWNIDSSQISPTDWQELAKLISEKGRLGQKDDRGNPKTYAGIVIIHGTDTMAYTASALAFMLQNPDRPIVLTGSQRPLEAWRSDARANLAAAVECATMDVKEVMVVFGDSILRGCRSTKADANSYSAFLSPEASPLGEIGTDLEIVWRRVRNPTMEFGFYPKLEHRVLNLTLFPGFNPKILKQNVENTDDKELIRALIIRGFGVGNIPLQGDLSIFPLIEYLRKKHIPVVMTSQCFRGHTELALYPSGRKLLDQGVIEARDMTFESVITKTMWALAHPEMSLQEWFNIDLAGEMSSY